MIMETERLILRPGRTQMRRNYTGMQRTRRSAPGPVSGPVLHSECAPGAGDGQLL